MAGCVEQCSGPTPAVEWRGGRCAARGCCRRGARIGVPEGKISCLRADTVDQGD